MTTVAEISTGTWLEPRDGARWFFQSGSLALDLAYTGDWGYGVPEWERLHATHDLTGWLTERFGPLATEVDGALLRDALDLRASIAAIARAFSSGRSADPADVDVVNDAARGPVVAPQLEGGSPSPPPTATEALGSIAHDAVATFGRGEGRVRECASDTCRLVFFDGSRSSSRHWCSMRRCGNRAKGRTFRDRHRGDAS